ncbi:Large ribosomal subunit protein uL10c-like protein [Drosera capensis]
MEISLSLLSSSSLNPLPLTPSYPNPRRLRLLPPHRRRQQQSIIRSAISRTKKEEVIETVRKHLEGCYLIAGINYSGFTVKQFEQLRRSLPEKTNLLVAKNTLVYKAVEGTKWAALEPCMKGQNCWLFVHTEEIPAALKPYRDFQKDQKLLLLEENDYTGACFEGKFYGPRDFKVLETMPSRAEVYAKLLGSLKSPATALVGTLRAPARDLVLVLMAYVKKLEDEQAVASASAQ